MYMCSWASAGAAIVNPTAHAKRSMIERIRRDSRPVRRYRGCPKVAKISAPSARTRARRDRFPTLLHHDATGERGPVPLLHATGQHGHLAARTRGISRGNRRGHGALALPHGARAAGELVVGHRAVVVGAIVGGRPYHERRAQRLSLAREIQPL